MCLKYIDIILSDQYLGVEFDRSPRRGKPGRQVVRRSKIAETAPFYVFTTFVVSYATGTLTYSRVTVLDAITFAAVVTCIAVPFMGWLADRVGSRVVYLGGTVLMTVFAGPYFMLLDVGQKWSITLVDRLQCSSVARGLFLTDALIAERIGRHKLEPSYR